MVPPLIDVAIVIEAIPCYCDRGLLFFIMNTSLFATNKL